jgi:hypothetical protein
MRDLEVQIGNSGFIVCHIFMSFWVTKTRAKNGYTKDVVYPDTGMSYGLLGLR